MSIPFTLRNYAVAGAMGLCAFPFGPAGAAVVLLDGIGNGPQNPVSLSLAAGTYRVDPLDGVFKAFTFADPAEDCNSDGTCKVGWSTSFGFALPVEGGFRATETAAGDFASPDLAFDNRIAAIFHLNSAVDVQFYIPDGYLLDNAGGLTLGVTSIPTPTDEGNPLLPTNVVDGRFDFLFTPELALIPRVWIDPEIALGYEYSVSGALFSTVTAPSFDLIPDSDGYQVEADGQIYDLLFGETVVFSSPTDAFRLSGIDPRLMLNPDNPLAFPLGVSFSNVGDRTVRVSQLAIREVIAPVPVPASLGLLGLGCALLAGGSLRAKRRRAG
jgi:hypothetical protein